MGDYPPGVSESDFYERDEYDDYVAECRADGDLPLPRRLWELDREDDEDDAD